MSTEFESPLIFPEQKVVSEWVDFNGHMNVAYYLMAFDRCVDDMYNRLDIGPEQIEDTNRSVFTLEAHINYLREVVEGDLLKVSGRLMDYDEKRVHSYFEMYHAVENHIVAATEQIGINVDMTARKPVAFTNEGIQALERMMSAHRNLGQAKYSGRVIGIPRQ